MSIPKNYYSKNLKIAFPIILSLAGQSVVQMIDAIMVGRLGAVPLAAVSLSSAIIINITMMGMGIAMSLTPLTGIQYTIGNHRNTAVLFQNSIQLNFGISILLCTLMIAIIPILGHIGQPQEVLDQLNGYYFCVAFSTIPLLLFLAFKQFFEGLSNTQIAMIITIGCNIINVFFNFGFIYGYMGFPELGVTGAGLATLLARCVMPIAFFICMVFYKKYNRYFNFFAFSNTSFKKQWELLKVGFPIAMQMTMEMFSLSLITILMGWIGTSTLAANQIVQTMIGFSFMVTNGVASASTILVSHAYGKKSIMDIRYYTGAGIRIGVLVMTVFAIIYAFGGSCIATIFTTDQEVIDIAAKLFIVVAFFEIFDGTQVTALGALRGLTDVTRPMYYAFICYILIAIPVAYTMAFPLQLGAQGIMCGFMSGVIIASFLFIRRFKTMVKRMEIEKNNIL